MVRAERERRHISQTNICKRALLHNRNVIMKQKIGAREGGDASVGRAPVPSAEAPRHLAPREPVQEWGKETGTQDRGCADKTRLCPTHIIVATTSQHTK